MTIESYVLGMTVLWALTGLTGLPLSLYGLRHAKQRLALARRVEPYDPVMILLAISKVRTQTIIALMFALMLVVLIAAFALPVGGLRTGVNSTLIVLFGLGLLVLALVGELSIQQAEKVSRGDDASVQTQKEYDDKRNVRRDAEHDALTDPLRAAAFESAAAEAVKKEKEDA